MVVGDAVVIDLVVAVGIAGAASVDRVLAGCGGRLPSLSNLGVVLVRFAECLAAAAAAANESSGVIRAGSRQGLGASSAPAGRVRAVLGDRLVAASAAKRAGCCVAVTVN